MGMNVAHTCSTSIAIAHVGYRVLHTCVRIDSWLQFESKGVDFVFPFFPFLILPHLTVPSMVLIYSVVYYRL